MSSLHGRILVTGGAGFIGSALVWALNQRGHTRQRIELAHDGRGIAQVFDSFKQGHHDQIAHCINVQSAYYEF